MTLEKSKTTKITQIFIYEKMTIDNWLSVIRKSYRRLLKINREEI